MATETKEKPQSQDNPLETGQPSDDKKATPKTISEAEHLKAVSDEKTISGRLKTQLEAATKEIDTFKTQAEQATREAQEAHEETKGRIADLETDLEEAIGEDADLRDIAKIKKDLRTERDKARQEAKNERENIAEIRKTTEAEREEWAGTVAEAQVFKFDGELAKIVDEYEGDVTANFNKLKSACDKAGIKTKEGAEAIAELYLTKKGEEPDLLVDSGTTTGGGVDLNGLSSRELLDRAYSKKK